ncbi:hypothetical protein IC620_16895, partial [Hazenella sp. IB182357]
EMTPFDEYIEKNKYPDTFLQKGELKDGVAKLYFFSNYEKYKISLNYSSEVDKTLLPEHFDNWSKGGDAVYGKSVEEALINTFEIYWLFPKDIKEVHMEIPIDGSIYIFKGDQEKLKKFVLDDLTKISGDWNPDRQKLRKAFDTKDPDFLVFIRARIEHGISKPVLKPFLSVK